MMTYESENRRMEIIIAERDAEIALLRGEIARLKGERCEECNGELVFAGWQGNNADDKYDCPTCREKRRAEKAEATIAERDAEIERLRRASLAEAQTARVNLNADILLLRTKLATALARAGQVESKGARDMSEPLFGQGQCSYCREKYPTTEALLHRCPTGTVKRESPSDRLTELERRVQDLEERET